MHETDWGPNCKVLRELAVRLAAGTGATPGLCYPDNRPKAPTQSLSRVVRLSDRHRSRLDDGGRKPQSERLPVSTRGGQLHGFKGCWRAYARRIDNRVNGRHAGLYYARMGGIRTAPSAAHATGRQEMTSILGVFPATPRRCLQRPWACGWVEFDPLPVVNEEGRIIQAGRTGIVTA